MGLHIDTWDNIPHHIGAPGRHVKVGWFRTIDPHVINLIIPGIEHLNLLVIPPDTTAATAHKAFACRTRRGYLAGLSARTTVCPVCIPRF